MSGTPWVRDVGADSFESEVIEASREAPVLVDFWAAWCGPCRVLGPVLERVADDMAGRLIVAKVDTEAHPQLAARYQIRSIPACKLFVGGSMVDEFVGALPEAAVREFLSRHVRSELDEALAEIARARGAGDLEEASTRAGALLEAHPSHPSLLLETARIALGLGDLDRAATLTAEIPIAADEYDAAVALLGAIELFRVCRDAGGLSAAGAKEPEDVAARYVLGACQASAGDYPAALATMLDVVTADRGYNDDAGRKAMLVIFALCEDEELVRDYRRRLSIVL